MEKERRRMIELRERTIETVRIYFEKSNTAEIKRVLPQKAQSVEEAIADFEKTQLPGATSYGRTVYVDDRYVGDIWCYCIDRKEEPNAMISYCIFDTEYWNKGIATEALGVFVEEVTERFQLQTLGAFTYASNKGSIRILEKNGFELVEEFSEDGVLSVYYQKNMTE